MQHAATATGHLSATDIDAAGIELTPKIVARRKANRRNMLVAQGVSYIVDAGLLFLFAIAGTTPLATPVLYGLCGVTMTLTFLALSEAGVNDRFSDHYLTVPQTLISTLIMLGGIYFAPEVGFAFCCVIFIIFGFSTLRMSSRQAGIVWTFVTIGLTGVFLLTERAPTMPHDSWSDRAITLLFLVTTLGRCIFMGLFAISMRETLYKRGKQLKEAYERIEEMAQLDELTGALSRRFVMKKLDDELLRGQRTPQPCTVALIDLDWFKRINDTYGHPAGDEALRTFSITIFANIRGIDVFGRYGGEEFLLVMPDTTQESGTRTLDRLREIVADLDWSAISPGMTVTMSAGITAIRANDTTDTVLNRADMALYHAKEGGRNRVHSS